MFVIGPKVRGGLYGEIFPESEIAKYDQPRADIDGLTSIERLFGSIADLMQPGSASLVFPQSNISSGVRSRFLITPHLTSSALIIFTR